MTQTACCTHCLLSLSLGPRAMRIVFSLSRHPEWERDTLSGLHFEFLNGDDRSRVTYQEIGRKHLDEGA